MHNFTPVHVYTNVSCNDAVGRKITLYIPVMSSKKILSFRMGKSGRDGRILEFGMNETRFNTNGNSLHISMLFKNGRYFVFFFLDTDIGAFKILYRRTYLCR